MRPALRRTIAELGELGLLARIEALVGPAPEDVVVGIGDDTAALRPKKGTLLLVTTDALVEDVHFRRSTSTPQDVGWKALAINASDIAAMGGRPRHAVISLMLPAGLESSWVEGLYEGLLEMAAEADVSIVGGNLAQAPAAIVDVTLLGEVAPRRLLRRSGARPGDLLAVTGTLGRAAAGLLALERGRSGGRRGVDARAQEAEREAVARAIRSQQRPTPRLAEGRVLAATRAVRAMIDLSDGLALDLWRLCEAGGVGVRLEADNLPVDPAVGYALRGTREEPLAVAMAGGEDYELLFAVAPLDAPRVLGRLEDETGTRATVIGTFEERRAGRRVVTAGRSEPLRPGGWVHFRPRPGGRKEEMR